MRRQSIVFLFLVVALFATAKHTWALEKSLVLVAHGDSEVTAIHGTNLRRLYLGLSPKNLTMPITPVGNRTDPILHEVFLQKVVHMSARSYERHLLTKVFHRGNQRLQVVEDLESLQKALTHNQNAITFMWSEEAERNPELRILQTIWQGNVR